jgi:predicted ATP-dependent serine protease
LQEYFINNAGPGAIVMGLKGTGSAAVGDTQASHAGWLEVGAANAPTYSGTRKTPTFTTVTTANPAVLATATAVVFTMTGSGTVAGAFINVGGSATIDNTTGVLFSAGDFTAGSKTVTSGDTINVSYSLSAS